jgi:hypothetical protein
MRVGIPERTIGLLSILSIAVVMSISLIGGCGDDDGTNPPPNNQNVAPAIDSLKIDAPIVAPSDTVAIRCFARDMDGDTLQYSWSVTGGTIDGTGSSVGWIAGGADGPHPIIVTVSDGRGGAAKDTVSVDVFGGTLLVQSRDGVMAVDLHGGSFTLNPSTAPIEVLGTRIFLKGNHGIEEIDHDGQLIQSTPISDPTVSGYNFTILPDAGFVFASNRADSVYFMDAAGTLLESVEMPNPSPESLQNIDGIVVGNRYILSENGTNELVAFDLTTHAGSVFRSFPDWGDWLGAIDHAGGRYYLCGSEVIRSFTETGEPEEIATFTQGNITGIAVVGSYAYVVVNFEGTLHRIDTRSGEDVILLSGLDYPQDVEYLPVALEPVPGRN